MEIDELWEQYQELMNKEVRDILTDEIKTGDIPYSEEVFGKHFGSTQDKIKDPVLMLIAENNAIQDEKWKLNEDVLISISKILKVMDEKIDLNRTGIKLTDNIVSANGIALHNIEKDLYEDDKFVFNGVEDEDAITSVDSSGTIAGDISSPTNTDSGDVTYGNMSGIPREVLNPSLIDTFNKLDKMFNKPTQKETKPMNMTAEEFYKDHFGHTSQHVSMDKIFVCMELYARHQKEEQETKQK
jgi:hypothetical protein